MNIENLFEKIPDSLPEEVTELLHSSEHVRMERIVSQGQSSPENFWYEQEEDEWVVLLSGSAGLRFENESETRTLKPGDYLFIPALTRHRVDWTDPDHPSVWLAVFVG